ncbi:hypothetical protein FA15DRAFT_700540 [Coprinopsis marcescibilis]|uniref:Uncharacterized protein n=1 Tax=Coprinopsis marcescibilis TaxID=230819 RepID=A0A5C3L844_COPMA|nr:hypothetical protein FA15DRAFT_700540 [Coprinopsis marcescibilis]
MPLTRKSTRQMAVSCEADPILATVTTTTTTTTTPAAAKNAAVKRAQTSKKKASNALPPAETVKNPEEAPAPVKQTRPRTTARGGKAPTKGCSSAASSPDDANTVECTTTNEVEPAVSQTNPTKPTAMPKSAQPGATTPGAPAKAPRKPKRPAAVIQAEREEKQRMREERERQKVVKAALAQRFEEYDCDDHKAATDSQATAVWNLQDAVLTLDIPIQEEYEDFTALVANVSSCESEDEEVGQLLKTAVDQGVSLKNIEEQIQTLKLTNGRSGGKGKGKSKVINSLPLASGLNPKFRTNNTEFRSNTVPQSSKVVFRDLGGLNDEDADGVPPFENETVNLTVFPRNAGALAMREKRAAPIVEIVSGVFSSPPPSVGPPPSTAVSHSPALYTHPQTHTQLYSMPIFTLPVFTPQANQGFQQNFAPPTTHNPTYQPQQFTQASTNPFATQGQGMQATAIPPTTNFLQPARKQVIKPALPTSRLHFQPIANTPGSQFWLANPRPLTAHAVHMENLPAFTQINNRWRASFLPTLMDALYTSDEPFKEFVIQTTKIQGTVQVVVNKVYPKVNYTVQLMGDPVHLLAYNRTFRTLTEAYNWLLWVKNFNGPLFFQDPTPLRSPHVQQEVVSENAIGYNGEWNPPVGLFALIMASLERTAHILEPNGQVKQNPNGSPIKLAKFSDENWGAKLNLNLKSLGMIHLDKWADILESCAPVQLDQVAVPVGGGMNIIADFEQRQNMFAYKSPRKGF